MERTFLTPKEALKAVNKNQTVYYQMTDGHCTIKKLSAGLYEFNVYLKGKLFQSYNGNTTNLHALLNKKGMFGGNTLYLIS